MHPGGPLMVEAFGGMDATENFIISHRKSFPHAKMEKYLVGEVEIDKNQK